MQEQEKHADKEELIAANSWMVISGSPVHEGRWSEITPTVKTLDQLTEALNGEGYNLKRLSVYLYLLPKNDRKTEGKWNVATAPGS